MQGDPTCGSISRPERTGGKTVYYLQPTGGESNDLYWHNSRSFRALEGKLKKLAREISTNGDIPDSEIVKMKLHIESSSACLHDLPGLFLIKWLREIVHGGTVDPVKRTDFLNAIVAIASGHPAGQGSTSEIDFEVSEGSLVINEPEPEKEFEFDSADSIVFKDRFFCFTGKFAFGTRPVCEAQVLQRGGKISRRPVLSTDYLIVGSLGGYGSKVDELNDLKRRGSFVRIIPENHWLKFL